MRARWRRAQRLWWVAALSVIVVAGVGLAVSRRGAGSGDDLLAGDVDAGERVVEDVSPSAPLSGADVVVRVVGVEAIERFVVGHGTHNVLLALEVADAEPLLREERSGAGGPILDALRRSIGVDRDR